jgi:hypothetical protein
MTVCDSCSSPEGGSDADPAGGGPPKLLENVGIAVVLGSSFVSVEGVGAGRVPGPGPKSVKAGTTDVMASAGSSAGRLMVDGMSSGAVPLAPRGSYGRWSADMAAMSSGPCTSVCAGASAANAPAIPWHASQGPDNAVVICSVQSVWPRSQSCRFDLTDGSQNSSASITPSGARPAHAVLGIRC